MDLPSQRTPGPDHAAPLPQGYEVLPAGAVEPKVKASTTAAGAAGIITGFLVWLLDLIFWNGDAPPDVPFPVISFVGLMVGAGLVFVAGFYARHVNRRVVQQ